MDIFVMEDLKELNNYEDGTLISIYIHTHRSGAEVQQDAIRLKNMLNNAEQELLEKGQPRTEVEAILKPAVDLLHDNLFWNHQSDGLALFLSHDWFRSYRLPARFEETLVISNRFHIKPLIPFISTDLRFFLLALSLDEVRLYQGDRYHLEYIDTDAFPESIDKALRYDDPERELQFHTQTDSPVSSAGRPAEFHGHSVSSQTEKKDRIKRYLQMVEKGVYGLIGDQTSPLLLAGVDYLLPIYRETNNYDPLLEEAILGNPENIPSQDLHEQAKKIIQPWIQQEKEKLASEYHALREVDKATESLVKIIPAAHQGRVKGLFVAKDREVWGNYNVEGKKVTIYEERDVGAEDLLDLAVFQTFIHGGDVYTVPEEDVPGGGVLSAIYRY